jgi:probable F420-dependent oxidoreductase
VTAGGAASLSLVLAGLGRLLEGRLARLLDLARAADDAGIGQLALPDHLAIGGRLDRYPYGRFPLPADEPWLEPMTALAAIAGATRRIRLATSVLIAPLRPALLLAKTAATLDVLSEGRLDLGLGIGWQREEFEAAGVPFRGRTARLDDAIGACRALWGGEPASFASESVRFEAISCLPRPVQRGGIPLWLGVAATPRNAARMAELGAGWMPVGSDVAALREGVARLREAWLRAGREPATLRVRAGLPVQRGPDGGADLERSLGEIPALREAGATLFAIPLAAFARGGDDVPAVLARLSRLS